MVGCAGGAGVYLPSAADDIICTLGDSRLVERNVVTRQHDVGFKEFTYDRNTALKMNVDVHYMILTYLLIRAAVTVTLNVVVVVYGGQDLILGEAVDINVTCNIQG